MYQLCWKRNRENLFKKITATMKIRAKCLSICFIFAVDNKLNIIKQGLNSNRKNQQRENNSEKVLKIY